MEKNSLFVKALQFAAEAHGKQVRKYSGLPYILHPIGVAAIVETVPHTDHMLAVALLHDVIEDTPKTGNDVLYFFGIDVTEGVEALTNDKSSEVRAVRKQLELEKLAKIDSRWKTVKLADLIHNTDDICANDPYFAKVYLDEKDRLLESLKGGDEELWDIARKQVTKYQTQLVQDRIRP